MAEAEEKPKEEEKNPEKPEEEKKPEEKKPSSRGAVVEALMRPPSAEALFSPEGVIMLPIAVIIDVLDFLIGSLLILDIVAILTIGVWIYFHSQEIAVAKGAAARLSVWAKRLKWLRPLMIILEFIPIVGMLPLWTLLVYFELKQ
jgi:hypothetical protein